MKVDEKESDTNHDYYQYLVTVDQAEEEEDSLIQFIRSEIKFLVDDDREGAKAYLKSFGDVVPTTAKEINNVKEDEESETPLTSGKKGKRGTSSAASVGASSGAPAKPKKQKVTLGPIIDPRKLKKDTEFEPHLFDLTLQSQCASLDFLQISVA